MCALSFRGGMMMHGRTMHQPTSGPWVAQMYGKEKESSKKEEGYKEAPIIFSSEKPSCGKLQDDFSFYIIGS